MSMTTSSQTTGIVSNGTLFGPAEVKLMKAIASVVMATVCKLLPVDLTHLI